MTPLVLAAALAAPAYDLAPGDHVVFRATFRRETSTKGRGWATRTEWENHMVVLSAAGARRHVGLQRNRTAAVVAHYQGLREEREAFAAARFARGSVLSEANWISPDGWADLPASAFREDGSEMLPFVSDLPPLPESALVAGLAFTGGPLAMKLRVAGTERHGDEDCIRIEGEKSPLKLRYDFCPAAGLPARMETSGVHTHWSGQQVRESLVLERVERRRGENAHAWLANPRTRLAVLDALLVAPPGATKPDALWRLLDEDDAEAHRRVLALAIRQRLEIPRDALRRLVESPNDAVRRLAGRLRDRAAGRAPLVSEALAAVARAVREEGPLPEWRCGDEPNRDTAMAHAPRARGQVPGATVRSMDTGAFKGWPYVLHVPEDYTGDEPTPLLVVLGGGSGPALRTAAASHAYVDGLGWLVAYPEASGLWWENDAPGMFATLLGELGRLLNVDTNRVRLTGFSNGGTGSLYFASRQPDRFAALGGRVPTVAGLTHLPFLFIHGERDGPEMSADVIKALRQADPAAPAALHVLAGRGHDVRLGSDDGLTLPFLDGHVRDPFRRTVRLRSAAPARSFWIEVVEKAGGLAEVDGTIAGSTIDITTRRVRKLRLLLRREHLDAASALHVKLNGKAAYGGPLEEDCRRLAESWRATGDPYLAHAWERTFEIR